MAGRMFIIITNLATYKICLSIFDYDNPIIIGFFHTATDTF